MSTNLHSLERAFNGHIEFKPRRPNLTQILVPLFHEDGDMVDIFVEPSPLAEGYFRITDCGSTLMHLSYEYDLDTENKRRIFNKIISENMVAEADGVLFADSSIPELYPNILNFAQTAAKVGSMRYFRREIVESLFYEQVQEVIYERLAIYKPLIEALPLPERPELEPDYAFLEGQTLPIYLFAAKDSAKVKNAAITFLEYKRHNLKFEGMVVHNDFTSLPSKDQSIILSAADKNFPTLNDFAANAVQVFEQRAA